MENPYYSYPILTEEQKRKYEIEFEKSFTNYSFNRILSQEEIITYFQNGIMLIPDTDSRALSTLNELEEELELHGNIEYNPILIKHKTEQNGYCKDRNTASVNHA